MQSLFKVKTVWNFMSITSIFAKDNKIVLYFEKNPVIKNDLNADWVKEHIKATGVEPGFF